MHTTDDLPTRHHRDHHDHDDQEDVLMHRFHTPTPPLLKVEFGAGSIRLETAEVDETTVALAPVDHSDSTAEQLVARTAIEQRGDAVVVLVPRNRGGRSTPLALTVTAPAETSLDVASGSADLVAAGSYGTTSIDAGSGDVTIEELTDSARVRAGSGDVRLDRVAEGLDVQSGSGDVHIGTGGSAIRAKVGSGDVEIDRAADEVEMTAGSGDIAVGHVRRGDVRVRAGSGDIRVSVAGGTAAWLDVRTVSGRVRNDLDAADAPTDEDERVRLRLQTASGDIDLTRA